MKMGYSKLLFLFTCLLFLLSSCRQQSSTGYVAEQNVFADSAMVVSPHPLASRIGAEILKQGGNAVDAAIAVQFAMAVVYPRAGNIGGGGFMVIRRADGKTDALDYREKAPLAASRDMYLDSTETVIDGLSRSGHLAAGVPGTVAGMVAAHEKYGSLSFEALLQPAIQLAEEGFRISQSEVERLTRFQEDFRAYNNPASTPFIKANWRLGDRLVQPDLARTLQLIQLQGRDGFYKGLTAEKIVAEMSRGGGIITLEDLEQYEARWRQPVERNYKNYRIISMPPPSSGGIALLQLLKMVEPYPIADWGYHSPETVHLMIEAKRRVYADRSRYLGDSDFYGVPQDSLLDSLYLVERMATFDPVLATSSDSIPAGYFQLPETFETTHTSIIDAQGNAVSVTTTLNSNYGCKVMVENAGFFLNNEMDDFSIKPGVPNQFGLIGAEANAIQPQKRMLSSMTPTIVEKNGRLFMVLGTPGGSTIITAIFQVLLNVIEFDMPLAEAVSAGRFHHQWLPNLVLVEKGAIDSVTIQKLEEMGHQFGKVAAAKVKAIEVLEDGRLNGVGDPRNPDDDAEGY